MRRRRVAFKTYWKLSDYPAVILPSLLSSHCHSHGYVRESRSAMYGSPHRQICSTRRTSRVPQHLPQRHACHKINNFFFRTLTMEKRHVGKGGYVSRNGIACAMRHNRKTLYSDFKKEGRNFWNFIGKQIPVNKNKRRCLKRTSVILKRTTFTCSKDVK